MNRRTPTPIGVLTQAATAALAATSGVDPDDDWDDEARLAAPPPVTVLLDPRDDAAVTKMLLAAHWPAQGRVTVHPTPSTAAPNALAFDVLVALGRPVTRLAEEKISGGIPAWQAVAAWVRAEQIEQIVVLRAHRLAAIGWYRLLELRARTGVSLVMVWHAPAPAPTWLGFLGDVPYRVVSDPAEVIDPDRLPPADTEHDEFDVEPVDPDRLPDTPRWDLPPLPEGDVASFRAEAYRQLPTEQFMRVDDAYHRGLQAACRWLSGHPELHDAATEIADPHYLRDLFPDSVSDEQASAGAAVLESRYPEHTLRALAGGLLCVGRGRETRTFPKRFPDEAGVQVFLGGLVADALSRRHAIARLRGAQAGALLHGLLLALPSDLARRAGPGLGAVPFGHETADRIRARIASPVHAAALAAALFTGCKADDLANALPIEALSEDAAVFAVPGPGGRDGARDAVFVVPLPARPLLAAARTFLLLRGTPPHRKLLYPGIGKDGAILQASAEAAELPLPVTNESLTRCWQATTTAWWVGTHLHHPGGEHA